MWNQIGIFGNSRMHGVIDTHLSSVVIDEDASQLLVGGGAVGVGRVGRRLGAASLRCVTARADQT